MYILASCCEGNINISKHDTYDSAYALMKGDYDEFIEHCEEQDEHYIDNYMAYVAYGYYYRCDWRIEEI